MDFIDLFYTKVIPSGIFIMMIGMGLSLTLTDLKKIAVFPKAFVIGLIAQLLIVPIIAFILVLLLQPTPAIAVGILILSVCPGGPTSNGYTFASRGDIALSIALTAVVSCITIFTIPIMTFIVLQEFMGEAASTNLPVMSMMSTLAMLTILPVSIGMLFRAYQEKIAIQLIEPLRKSTLWFLVIIIGGSAIISLKDIWMNIIEAGLIAMLLNIICMSSGYMLAKTYRLPVSRVIAITYEVGIQNLALALTVTMVILKMPELGLTVLVYGIFMKITALSFMAYSRKLTASEDEVADAHPVES
jgi:BASS family bile acid:Na+ symporter